MADKDSMATRVCVAAGTILTFNLFLPWYRQDGLGGLFKEYEGSFDAFGSGFLAWFGSLCAILAAVIMWRRSRGKTTGDTWPIKPELAALGLSLVGFVLILVRLITDADQLWLGLLIGLGATIVMVFVLLPEAGIQISAAPRPAAPETPPPPPPAGE